MLPRGVDFEWHLKAANWKDVKFRRNNNISQENRRKKDKDKSMFNTLYLFCMTRVRFDSTEAITKHEVG